MERPIAEAPPPPLPFESVMVDTIDRTEQIASEIDVVNPYWMVTSRSLFHYTLEKMLLPHAERSNDPSSSSMTGSTPTTNTSASYCDTKHDLHEDAEKTTMNFSAIYTLWEIAKGMRSEGHVSECIQIYKTVRKDFLHTSLLSFGIEKQSTEDMRRLLSIELEERMDLCVKACNVSFSILFPLEMKLCDEIFEGDEIAVCYSETIEDTLAQLIGYADSLIGARRATELLFKHLDLYTALVKLQYSSGVSCTKRWEDSEDKLVEIIRCLITDFEKLVIDELSCSSTSEASYAGVVSLTKYVMHYLIRMAKYKDILTELIECEPALTNIGSSDVEYAQLFAGRTPLELHVVYIVVLLRFKIESKSRYYYKADSAESYLFLANNLAHVVRCIAQSSELEDLVGISYVEKLRNEYLAQAMRNYQTKTCENMLQCLRKDTAGRCFPGIASSTITIFKRKINSFYSMFEEARLNQARLMELVKELQTWEVFSVPVKEELVVAYTTFLERYKHKGGTTDQNAIDYHIKYSPHEIRSLIKKDFLRV